MRDLRWSPASEGTGDPRHTERRQISLCKVVFPGRETLRGSHVILCDIPIESKSCAILGASTIALSPHLARNSLLSFRARSQPRAWLPQGSMGPKRVRSRPVSRRDQHEEVDNAKKGVQTRCETAEEDCVCAD